MSMLKPPDTDISLNLLKMLLGPDWYQLSSSGSGGVATVLGQMFTTMDVALLAFVSALAVYQVTIGAMHTAHEGVSLGKKYHTIWAPLRTPTAFVLLSPLPWLKGFSFLQAMLLTVTYWGIGIADTTWGTFMDYVHKNNGIVYTTGQTFNNASGVAVGAMEISMLQAYLNSQGNPITGTWKWEKDLTGARGHWVYSLGGYEKYGSISIACGTDHGAAAAVGWFKSFFESFVSTQTQKQLEDKMVGVKGNENGSPSCVAGKQAVESALNGTMTIAKNIIAGKKPSIEKYAAISSTYTSNVNKQVSLLNNPKSSDAQSQLAEFTQSSKDMGWASMAFYWWTLSNIQSTNEAKIQSLIGKVKEPDYAAALNNQQQQDYKAYLSSINALVEGAKSSTLTSQVKSSSKSATAGTDNSSDPGILSSLLYATPDAMMQGNMLVNVAAIGHNLINIGTAVIAGGVAIKVLSSIGPLAALSKATGGGLGSIFGGLAKIAFGLAIVFMIEGATLAYVIPMIPAFITVAAVIGFLLLVIEMMVAAPLWATAFGFADGDGFTPQEARSGYALVGGIVMRPMLLVFGFVFAYLMIEVGGYFLGAGMKMFTMGMVGTSVGPIAFITILGVYIGMILAMVNMILKFMTHLAKHVPIWIGGQQGYDLGVDEVANSALGKSEAFSGEGGRGGRAVSGMAGYALGGGRPEAKPRGTQPKIDPTDDGGNGGGNPSGGGGLSKAPGGAGVNMSKGGAKSQVFTAPDSQSISGESIKKD